MKIQSVLISILLVVVVLLLLWGIWSLSLHEGVVSMNPPDSWSHFSGMTNSYNRVAPYPGPSQGKIKWSASVFQQQQTPPYPSNNYPNTSNISIGPDGTIYFGSTDSNLYAYSPSGAPLWSFHTGGMIVSTPTVGPDGTIYVGSFDKKLYAITPPANMTTTPLTTPPVATAKWVFDTTNACSTCGGKIFSCPAIGPDGNIYFGCYDSTIYAINGTSGSMIWFYKALKPIASSPCITTNGIMYIMSSDNILLCFDINANSGMTTTPLSTTPLSTPTVPQTSPYLKWYYITGISSEGVCSPCFGSDGTVYFGSSDGTVYAISPSGKPLWTFPTGGIIVSSPAMSPDGKTLYVNVGDGYLYALSTTISSPTPTPTSPTSPTSNPPTPTQIWKFNIRKSTTTSTPNPLITPTITPTITPSITPTITPTMTPTSTSQEYNYSSPAVDSNGTIYIASTDSNLYAISSNGSLLWSLSLSNSYNTSPSIHRDGTLYIVSNTTLYAINETSSVTPILTTPNGTTPILTTPNGTTTNPIISSSGMQLDIPPLIIQSSPSPSTTTQSSPSPSTTRQSQSTNTDDNTQNTITQPNNPEKTNTLINLQVGSQEYSNSQTKDNPTMNFQQVIGNNVFDAASATGATAATASFNNKAVAFSANKSNASSGNKLVASSNKNNAVVSSQTNQVDKNSVVSKTIPFSTTTSSSFSVTSLPFTTVSTSLPVPTTSNYTSTMMPTTTPILTTIAKKKVSFAEVKAEPGKFTNVKNIRSLVDMSPQVATNMSGLDYYPALIVEFMKWFQPSI